VWILPIALVSFRTTADNVQDQNNGKKHCADGDSNVKWSEVSN
jgi:hypothetical protein